MEKHFVEREKLKDWTEHLVGRKVAKKPTKWQMAIPHATVTELANKGITIVDNLAEFDKDTIDQQIVSNLHRPAVAPAAGGHHFVLGAKLQKRMIAPSELVRFYITVGRPLTPLNIQQWVTVIQNFEIQW